MQLLVWSMHLKLIISVRFGHTCTEKKKLAVSKHRGIATASRIINQSIIIVINQCNLPHARVQ